MITRAAALVLALACVGAAGAHAQPWADVEVLNEAEMRELRGGVRLPNGVEVNFAATVSTYANDALALRTELTLTSAGLEMHQTVGDLAVPLQSLSPEQRASLGLIDIGDSGVVILDDTGVTALVQNIGAEGLQNIVFNTGSGRALRQDIDVTITLPGFVEIQRAIGQEIVAARLGADLGAMLVMGPGD